MAVLTDIYLRNSPSRWLRGFRCEQSRMQGRWRHLGRNTVSPGYTDGMTCRGKENLSTSLLPKQGVESGVSAVHLVCSWSLRGQDHRRQRHLLMDIEPTGGRLRSPSPPSVLHRIDPYLGASV